MITLLASNTFTALPFSIFRYSPQSPTSLRSKAQNRATPPKLQRSLPPTTSWPAAGPTPTPKTSTPAMPTPPTQNLNSSTLTTTTTTAMSWTTTTTFLSRLSRRRRRFRCQNFSDVFESNNYLIGAETLVVHTVQTVAFPWRRRMFLISMNCSRYIEVIYK